LKKLDFPIAIFGGTEDKLADPTDVQWTYEQMKNTVIFYH
jgi:surfactin synthase thioesterase subunit